MFYYNYDTKKCILLSEITESEATATSVKSAEQFDLNLYNVYVAILDNDRKIIRYTKIVKDDEAIFRTLATLQEENEDMKTKIASFVEAIERGLA